MEQFTVSQIGILRNQGSYEEAVRVGKAILNITQDFEQKILAYLGLAEVMSLQGKNKERDEMMDLANKATKMSGVSPSLRVKYCKLQANYIRTDKKSLESELQLLSEANTLDNTDIAVINGIIHALRRLGNIDLMKKWIVTTLEKPMETEQKAKFLGLVFTTCVELGWYTLAISCIAEHPDKDSNAGIILVRATCLNRLFSFQEARQDLQNVKEYLKSNPNYYTEYIRACLFCDDCDYLEIASLFRELRSLNVRNPDFMHLSDIFKLKSAKSLQDRLRVLEKIWNIYFGNTSPGTGKIHGIVELLICLPDNERDFVQTKIPSPLKGIIGTRLRQSIRLMQENNGASAGSMHGGFFSDVYKPQPINSNAARVTRLRGS